MVVGGETQKLVDENGGNESCAAGASVSKL